VVTETPSDLKTQGAASQAFLPLCEA
jgi:hypothetical protein